MRFNIRGPNWTPAAGGCSGSTAFGEALVHIRDGRADMVLSGGAESVVTPMVICGMAAMGSLCLEHQDDPEHAVRPFDQSHCGTAVGAGSGILILEELEHAKARGADILCELVGYGTSQDEGVPNHPRGTGLKQAAMRALKSAELEPKDIGYINAHGTAVPEADLAEAKALCEVFGDAASQTVLGSTKGATGDLLGAAGALEGVITALSVGRGEIPPSVNLQTPDPSVGSFRMLKESEKSDLQAAMSVNFGIGGVNTALIFKRYAA